jgi:hypothetical protein
MKMPKLPQDDFKENMLPGGIWPTAREEHIKLKWQGEKSFYYFIVPDISNEFIVLIYFVKCFSKSAYLWACTKTSSYLGKKRRGLLRPEIHLLICSFCPLSTILFLLPLALEAVGKTFPSEQITVFTPSGVWNFESQHYSIIKEKISYS